MTNLSTISRWAAAITLLCSVYLTYHLNTQVRWYLSGAEKLVRHSLQDAATEGVFFRGGFMICDWVDWARTKKDDPYFSQYGLQYKLLAWSAYPFGNHTAVHRGAAKLTIALFLSAVLALYCATVMREFGTTCGIVTYACLLFLPQMAMYATSLYWIGPLLFLPFIFSFYAYDKFRAQKKFLAFFTILGGLIFVKSLCGYEYLSSILLSALVPVVYYESKARSPSRRIVWRVAAGFLSGTAGFALAFAMTWHQAARWLGSFRSGWVAVTRPVIMRTTGSETGQPIPFATDINTYSRFYFLNNQLLIIAISILLCAILYRLTRKNNIADTFTLQCQRSWPILLGGSLIASLSWNLLAWGHMRNHLHMNWITFYLPFNLVAITYGAYIISNYIHFVQSKPGLIRSDTGSEETKHLEIVINQDANAPSHGYAKPAKRV